MQSDRSRKFFRIKIVVAFPWVFDKTARPEFVFVLSVENSLIPLLIKHINFLNAVRELDIFQASLHLIQEILLDNSLVLCRRWSSTWDGRKKRPGDNSWLKLNLKGGSTSLCVQINCKNFVCHISFSGLWANYQIWMAPKWSIGELTSVTRNEFAKISNLGASANFKFYAHDFRPSLAVISRTLNYLSFHDLSFPNISRKFTTISIFRVFFALVSVGGAIQILLFRLQSREWVFTLINLS